jgi:PPIC-type PPIASE domain
MRRFVPLVLAAAAVLALLAGTVVLAAGDGPPAFTVGGHSVSQSSMDDELQALAENETLSNLIAQGGGESLSLDPKDARGSVTANLAASWVGLRVAQEVVRQQVARDGLEPTRSDGSEATVLAEQSVGGIEAFGAMPEWFRKRLIARWTAVAILERELIASPTPALVAAAAAECPSGRYVAHIVVDSQLAAEAIKDQLDAGVDFAQLATSNSTDPGAAENSGYYGCLDGLADAVEPFLSAATTQPIGVVSDPVETEFGFHLILVTDQPTSSELASVAVVSVLDTATNDKDVTVDPRYGTWDRANGQVLPPGVANAAG